MRTIYVSPRDTPIITADRCLMTVKKVTVCEANCFISLQDWKPPSELGDIEVVLARKFYSRKIQLPYNVKQAILYFLRHYHAKSNMSFDCYAFANLVKGVKNHKVRYMLKYWNRKTKPCFMKAGSVIFLESGENRFLHAAVYIGYGLYISVWGAGGDLEVATLKSMERDFYAERIVFAVPKTT